jgi:deoxyribose-phosphate aldolase
MINAITTHLELDIDKSQDLDQAFQLAGIHKLPAIIVSPQIIPQALPTRIKRRGLFKIIAPIDWPRGDSYGNLKMRGISDAMLRVDGYEIMLTGNCTPAETRNEAKALIEFVKTFIGQQQEVRFVLETATRPADDVIKACDALKTLSPNFLRLDHHTKTQAMKANPTLHGSFAARIKEVNGRPLKASGNVHSIAIVRQLIASGFERVAVNFQQFLDIIKELKEEQRLEYEAKTAQRATTIPA